MGIFLVAYLEAKVLNTKVCFFFVYSIGWFVLLVEVYSKKIVFPINNGANIYIMNKKESSMNHTKTR